MAAAGVQTTKGLYFTFTLLCLVCLASSLTGKDKLEKLKHDLQRAQEQLDRVKAKHESEMATSLEQMDEYMNIMERIEASVRKTHLADDFPPLEELLQISKGSMEKSKTFIERQKEQLDADIEKTEKEVRQMKKLVEFLEENQAEL